MRAARSFRSTWASWALRSTARLSPVLGASIRPALSVRSTRSSRVARSRSVHCSPSPSPGRPRPQQSKEIDRGPRLEPHRSRHEPAALLRGERPDPLQALVDRHGVCPATLLASEFQHRVEADQAVVNRVGEDDAQRREPGDSVLRKALRPHRGQHALDRGSMEAPHRKLAMILRPRRCASARPGAPRPGRWGSPPNPCLGWNFWRRGDGSFRTGRGSVRLRRPKPAPDRRLADESTSGPEGEDDHPGTGKPGRIVERWGFKFLKGHR